MIMTRDFRGSDDQFGGEREEESSFKSTNDRRWDRDMMFWRVEKKQKKFFKHDSPDNLGASIITSGFIAINYYFHFLSFSTAHCMFSQFLLQLQY